MLSSKQGLNFNTRIRKKEQYFTIIYLSYWFYPVKKLD